MNADYPLSRSLAQRPVLAATLYLAAFGALWMIGITAGFDIAERRAALADTSALLSQLKERKGAAHPLLASERSGSPFLEGPTVTVAGAALLQRVISAVQAAGGLVQSSSVDVAGAAARDNLVALLLSCELEQTALQGMLYDLEAGMPFLFVDQLDIQAPQGIATEDGPPRLRVVLGVSGRWEAAP